jgi:alpha-L-arabinofuranosidase
MSVARKAVKKKTKPISSAVFRGKKDRYDFQVFPIDAEFEDVSAIYIISKRKIDKRKKAHHALVCIGQTDSILDEMKKHKKGKCVKQHQANAISILPETNEKTRLKIETDLKAAHAIPYIHA